MSDLIKKIKIKKQDGTFTDYIPIGAEAQNISTNDGDSVQLKLNKKPYYYNSVADMKADTKLKAGDMAITLGYYESNDGGGAKYEIVNDMLVEDEAYIHELSNGLFARMIIENNTINFKQLGAKNGDKTFDCKSYIEKYISICNRDDITYKLIIDDGIWYFSPTLLYRAAGVWIEGSGRFRASTVTEIHPITEEQSYIWKIGGLADIHGTPETQIVAVRSAKVDGLCFAGNNVGGVWSKLDSALYVDCCMYCTFDNLYFQNLWGTALSIRQSWELYWGMLNFRGIAGFDTPCLHIAPTTDPYQGVSENVSANYFNYMMFEGIDGNYIYSEGMSGFEHNEINDIQIELSVCNGQRGTTRTGFNDSNYGNRITMTPTFIFKGFARYLCINMINIFTTGGFYATNNSHNYYLAGIIGNDEDETSDYYGVQDIAINLLKVASRGNYPIPFIYSHNPVGSLSLISVSNIHFCGIMNPIPFDVDGGGIIRIGNYNIESRVIGNDYVSKGECLYKYVNNKVLVYDEDALSPTKMVVAGNIKLKALGLCWFRCEGNKAVKLRVKGNNNVTYRFRLQGTRNGIDHQNVYFNYTGTGVWDYITCTGLNFDDGKTVQIIGAFAEDTSLKFDTIELIDEPSN